MDEISARNVKGDQTIEIDPRFFFPDSVIDLRYAQDTAPGQFSENVELVNTNDDVDAIIIDGKIPAPSEITIVSQTVRVAPDGQQVIDVTLDVVGEAYGNTYNVRISKS